MSHSKISDVIVVGGGHAGVEAALAAARMGKQTLLVTQNIDTIGQMSCNPAIGGIGKSHLVKEIDAMGGAIAHATDLAGIHFRVLNARKGPAVRATRAQTDRALYRSAIRALVEQQENLQLFQQSIEDLIVEEDQVRGVVTQLGIKLYSKTVVLTVGTFLAGKIHIGDVNYAGGRAGEAPSSRLAQRFRELPFTVGRLKTGTPPRIDASSVDFSQMTEQPGDTPLPVMSYIGSAQQHPEQVSCYITHTNAITHEIIAESIDRSPLFSGAIEGVGPRYCPSIEDKIFRFSDKSSHQVFVEPEGLNTQELYPNGISTSLPFDVQYKIVHSIVGFEQAHITRPGYAIEYDFFDPRGLSPTLETKSLQNLYFAGQINGTTGYEEAAAQGLMAGINAALNSADKPGIVLRRDEAYIGVLIDDLVTLGTKEPYRMFTSRAEYRLMLREDNADQRLTELARSLGLVDDGRWQTFSEKQSLLNRETERLKTTWVSPQRAEGVLFEQMVGKKLSKEITLYDLLRRPDLDYSHVASLNQILDQSGIEDLEVAQIINFDAKYDGYIERQKLEVAKVKAQESVTIPVDMDYTQIRGLSNELQQKLTQVRPLTIGQAMRIAGMTPSAISLLLVWLKRSDRAERSRQSRSG